MDEIGSEHEMIPRADLRIFDSLAWRVLHFICSRLKACSHHFKISTKRKNNQSQPIRLPLDHIVHTASHNHQLDRVTTGWKWCHLRVSGIRNYEIVNPDLVLIFGHSRI